MKLFRFRVEISTEILVLAETRVQAREIAQENSKDALCDEEAFVDSGYEVTDRSFVDHVSLIVMNQAKKVER